MGDRNGESGIVENCCFCIELRVGCFIIAYLELIASVIATVWLIMAMMAGGMVMSAGSQLDPEIAAGLREAGGAIVAITGVLLVIVVLGLTFVIALLVGLHQEKRGHIKAYLVYASVFIVIEFIIFVIGCTSNRLETPYVIGNVIAILLHIYFMVVIRSYYVSLRYSNRPAVKSGA